MPESNFELPEFTVDAQHCLACDRAAVKRVSNPKNDQPLRADTIVIHYTAGASAASSANSLADPEVKASAHLVVGRGIDQIYQVTPFDTVAWHAGKSEYTFPGGEYRHGFNSCSIGIEIDNPGELTPTLDGHRTWFGREVPGSEVVHAVHRNQSTPKFWHAYSQDQIAMVHEICRALIARYDIKHILGHEEISPERKTDPGPAFPLDKLRNHLLGANRRDETAVPLFPAPGLVTAERLNIRAAGSAGSPRVSVPLEQGVQVTALQEKDGWYLVEARISGWVDSRFVDLDRG
jgi:N-acetylmuramoyl-L-alanine amidase